MPSLPTYTELHCLSNFTFLRGASHAKELVARGRPLDAEADLPGQVGFEVVPESVDQDAA